MGIVPGSEFCVVEALPRVTEKRAVSALGAAESARKSGASGDRDGQERAESESCGENPKGDCEYGSFAQGTI
jgi:hypothetical protein